MKVKSQQVYLGDCYFPAAEHGLAQRYDLPMPEDELIKMIPDPFSVKGGGLPNEIWNLFDKVWYRNPIISPTDHEGKAFHFLLGVGARFPEDDIRFFLKIGAGLGRSETEVEVNEKAQELAKEVAYNSFSNQHMSWVLSPKTAIRHALRFEENYTSLAREVVEIAKLAKEKRRTGRWKPAFPERESLLFS